MTNAFDQIFCVLGIIDSSGSIRSRISCWGDYLSHEDVFGLHGRRWRMDTDYRFMIVMDEFSDVEREDIREHARRAIENFNAVKKSKIVVGEWFEREFSFYTSLYSTRPTKVHLLNKETGLSYCKRVIQNDRPGDKSPPELRKCKRCSAAIQLAAVI